MNDVIVPGAPALAVHDFGGTGAPVMLLHGFGGKAADWTDFAALLTDRFRVYAMDLRGHGDSADGEWTWDLLVSDVSRVVAQRGLSRPAVVGHSLGGGVAALWARQHPDCPGVVNLDGLRPAETTPDNYPDLDPSVLASQLSELTAQFEAQAASMSTMDIRPNPATVTAFRTLMRSTDPFEVIAESRCPQLICAATKRLPGTDQFAELMAAQLRGVARDLAAVVNPLVRVEYVPASHDLVREIPDQLAALIHDFLSDHGGR